MRSIVRLFLLIGLAVVVPGVAAAQATLAGEAKDGTGAVLPGVTVEAASPALTGKVRTAVTDVSGLSAFVRSDFEVIGPTWFYPDNFTKRDPVRLLNLRGGIDRKSWSATVWAKNLTNKLYNAEWSPGPMFFPNPGYTNNFVFKAMPRRWGADLSYRF